MASKPTISIITICYNAAASIEATMRSVFAQEYPDLEYIIIDGGSTDGTQDLISKEEARLSYWLSEPDKGISDAFNKGIAQANGELIGLLNADDEFLPGALQAIAAGDTGEHVLYGDMLTMVDGKEDGVFHPDHASLEKDMTLCHPSTFIRKTAYDLWGDYSTDFRLAMDYELLLRYKQAGATFKKIDHTITAMTMDGVSNQNWKQALDEVQLAQEQQLGPSISRHLKAGLKKQRRSVAHKLEGGALGSVVHAYRKRFSAVKKSK